MAEYEGAMDAATEAYNRTAAGYRELIAQQTAAQNAQQLQYWNNYTAVLAGIQGANTADQRQIEVTYAKAAADMQQRAARSGLSNSTGFLRDMYGGLTQSLSDARTRNANEFAKTTAGYQAQLATQATNYGAQNIRDNAQLGEKMYGDLGQYEGARINAAGANDQRQWQERMAQQQRMSGGGVNVIGGGVSSAWDIGRSGGGGGGGRSAGGGSGGGGYSGGGGAGGYFGGGFYGGGYSSGGYAAPASSGGGGLAYGGGGDWGSPEAAPQQEYATPYQPYQEQAVPQYEVPNYGGSDQYGDYSYA